jgi:hypothetical protein
MPKVRAGSGKRWSDRASIASDEYKSGVQNPRGDWATNAAAAADNQALGIQQAISEKRYEKGIQKAGTAKWRDKALSKGASRFVQGVQVSQGDYEKGVKPYLDTIESTTLPPKYPKGDPRNLARVEALNKALRAKKLGG